MSSHSKYKSEAEKNFERECKRFCLTVDEMNEQALVGNSMLEQGGAFITNLGLAVLHADAVNYKKLKKAFPGYWEEFKTIGKSTRME